MGLGGAPPPVTSCPHAPYLDGPADFAIGLRPIAEARWLEPGEAPEAARARKLALLETAPDRVWAERADSRSGQSEAAGLIKAATGTASVPPDGPPLLAAALGVSDDLCLMERRNEAWTLTALSLSAGTFFTAAEVVGSTLAELHGPVPGFGQRLLPRVIRIFDALRPGLILERRNWTVTASDALHLPEPEPVRTAAGAIPLEEAGERLFVRVERQTLRRLPETAGLLFTIRVWTESLSRMSLDPVRLEGFRQAWRSAAPEFRTYKGLHAYDRAVEHFLTATQPELLATGE